MLKVKKVSLILVVGIVWTLVGLMLIKKAVVFLDNMTDNHLIISFIGGLVLGLVKLFFVFKKSTVHNINRIMSMKDDKVFILAFHTLKFYFLIALMIGTGIFLRHSSYIPKYVVTSLYFGIGIGMIVSSLRYYKYYYNNYKRVNA